MSQLQKGFWVLCIATSLHGCATGVGCLAGGVTGAVGLPLLVAAESEPGDNPSYASAIVVGAALGAVTGCISGSFAAGRARTLERRKHEEEQQKVCPEKPPVYVPVPYYPGGQPQPPGYTPQSIPPSQPQPMPPGRAQHAE